MINFNSLLPAVLLLLLFVSCEEYVPDPIDPRLPKYSQEGKNTAGALLDGTTVFRSDERCSILGCSENFTIISFPNGATDSVQLEINIDAPDDSRSAFLRFTLADKRLENFNDVETLVGVYEISPTGPHKGYFNGCPAQSGRLEVKHLEFTTSHGGEPMYIISGTFSLYTENPSPDSPGCGTAAVEWGRFDFERNEPGFLVW